jgi:hypothetical protein
MPQMVYSREELLASHAYARPHEEVGYKLHGGFLADGDYVSPRVLHRWPAVKAWADALVARGGVLIDCSRRILTGDTYPTREQQRLLLENGFGQTFWNALTNTGVIEARGGALCQVPVPDFQALFVEDVSKMAVGHLHKGLLYAHGADEAGDPDHRDFGAHDKMWFACRDMVFGKNAYPRPEVAQTISRPAASDRELPQIPPQFEQLIKFMMNILMIEVRAENFFQFCRDVFSDPANFKDKRAEAEKAKTIVDRIAKDETIHVGYLQCALSEMRTLTFKTLDGGTIKGDQLLDPLWAKMVAWPSAEARAQTRAQTRKAIAEQVVAKLGEKDGAALLAKFDALLETPKAV